MLILSPSIILEKAEPLRNLKDSSPSHQDNTKLTELDGPEEACILEALKRYMPFRRWEINPMKYLNEGASVSFMGCYNYKGGWWYSEISSLTPNHLILSQRRKSVSVDCLVFWRPYFPPLGCFSALILSIAERCQLWVGLERDRVLRKVWVTAQPALPADTHCDEGDQE